MSFLNQPVSKPKLPSMLTVSECAEIFSVTPYTVRLWLKRGTLKGTKPAGEWRVTLTDAQEFAKGRLHIS